MTNPMTLTRLKEIKARCEAATEGPWWKRWTENRKQRWIEASDGKRFIVVETKFMTPCAELDLSFIAHARQDLPDCLAEIERLQGVLDEIAGVPEKYKEAE